MIWACDFETSFSKVRAVRRFTHTHVHLTRDCLMKCSCSSFDLWLAIDPSERICHMEFHQIGRFKIS
uniref:Uncharacterized protein n=1 Tax=Kalanchoe fedtschenkoi TaxID=63787 RepID=A0A7N0V9M0_KALFE